MCGYVYLKTKKNTLKVIFIVFSRAAPHMSTLKLHPLISSSLGPINQAHCIIENQYGP